MPKCQADFPLEFTTLLGGQLSHRWPNVRILLQVSPFLSGTVRIWTNICLISQLTCVTNGQRAHYLQPVLWIVYIWHMLMRTSHNSVECCSFYAGTAELSSWNREQAAIKSKLLTRNNLLTINSFQTSTFCCYLKKLMWGFGRNQECSPFW